MSLPFIDLKAQFKAVESHVRARIDRVLDHGQFIMGPEVEELEKKALTIHGGKVLYNSVVWH